MCHILSMVKGMRSGWEVCVVGMVDASSFLQSRKCEWNVMRKGVNHKCIVTTKVHLILILLPDLTFCYRAHPIHYSAELLLFLSKSSIQVNKATVHCADFAKPSSLLLIILSTA